MNLNMIVMIKGSVFPDLAGKVGVVVATDTRLGQGGPAHMCKVRVGNIISDWIPRNSIELLGTRQGDGSYAWI